jgi:hypothetical protein
VGNHHSIHQVNLLQDQALNQVVVLVDSHQLNLLDILQVNHQVFRLYLLLGNPLGNQVANLLDNQR